MMNPSLIVSVVRKGWGNTVLEATVKAGASGGTILPGRGVGVNEKDSIFGIPIEPEKEIILTLVERKEVENLLQAVIHAADLNKPGHGLAFVVPVEKIIGIPHMSAKPAA